MINVHAVGMNDKIYKKSQFLNKISKIFFLNIYIIQINFKNKRFIEN